MDPHLILEIAGPAFGALCSALCGMILSRLDRIDEKVLDHAERIAALETRHA